MTDDQKKAVTEWLGECYFEGYGKCPHCGHYCSGSTVFCNPPIKNRTFTADSDFFACFNRLVELGEWGNFISWAFHNQQCNHVDFDIWYHGKNPDGTWRLCTLTAEWRRKEESNER